MARAVAAALQLLGAGMKAVLEAHWRASLEKEARMTMGYPEIDGQ